MRGWPTTLWVGLCGTVWPLHMGADQYGLGRSVMNKNKNKRNKNLGKIEFSPRGLAHRREIFTIDAAFVAAYFPSRVVWGPNPMNGDISP